MRSKSADSSVAGQYGSLGLAGRNTLLELFAGAIPGPRRYTAGLVFSFEDVALAGKARELLGEAAHAQLVERGGQPWYHLLAPHLGDCPVLVMCNQVTPEYFASLGAEPGHGGRLSRQSYLDATLGEPDSGRLLGDLTGATVRMRPGPAKRLRAVLESLGCNDFTVTIEVDEVAPEGVTEVAMSLTSVPPQRKELVFGTGSTSSRLVLDTDGTGRWCFEVLE